MTPRIGQKGNNARFFVKRFLLPFLCLVSATGVQAASQGFELEQLVLYQSGDVIEERLSDFNKLSEYVKRLRDVCQKFFAVDAQPEMLDVVVAVRPGRKSRIWFVSSRQSKPDAKRESLRRELEKVKPCDVKNGPIVFAIAGKVAGGDGKRRMGSTPMPAEWQRAAERQKNVVIPDGVLDLVWPGN